MNAPHGRQDSDRSFLAKFPPVVVVVGGGGGGGGGGGKGGGGDGRRDIK